MISKMNIICSNRITRNYIPSRYTSTEKAKLLKDSDAKLKGLCRTKMLYLVRRGSQLPKEN